MLMGLLCPYVVAYIFSARGDLVRRVCREWEYPAPRMAEGGPYEIYDPAFRAAVSMQIRRLQTELGFTPGLIRVREFYDVEQEVGIEQLPEHLQDIDEEDEDVEEMRAELAKWCENGSFVLAWGNDYWMSAEGKVEST